MQLLLINKMFLRTHKSPVGNPCQLSRSIRYFCHAGHLVLNNSNFVFLTNLTNNLSIATHWDIPKLREIPAAQCWYISLLVEIGKSQPLLFQSVSVFYQMQPRILSQISSAFSTRAIQYLSTKGPMSPFGSSVLFNSTQREKLCNKVHNQGRKQLEE